MWQYAPLCHLTGVVASTFFDNPGSANDLFSMSADVAKIICLSVPKARHLPLCLYMEVNHVSNCSIRAGNPALYRQYHSLGSKYRLLDPSDRTPGLCAG